MQWFVLTLYIVHRVGVLSMYISKLGKDKWIIVKIFFKYLHGTTNYRLCYQGRHRLKRVFYIYNFVYVH